MSQHFPLLTCAQFLHDALVCRGLSRLRQWEVVVAAAASLGAAPLPLAAAMANGSAQLHTAFAAAVFRARHGLRPDAASVETLRARALVVRRIPHPEVLSRGDNLHSGTRYNILKHISQKFWCQDLSVSI